MQRRTVRWICVTAFLVGAAWNQATLHAQNPPDKRLTAKATVVVDAVSCAEVLKGLAERHKIMLKIDDDVATNKSLEAKLSMHADNVPLEAALNVVCRIADVGYVFDKGTLRVISDDSASKLLYPVTYPLAPIAALRMTPQELAVNLQVVTGALWQDIDGVGGAFVTVDPRGLVIQQTRRAHAEIASVMQQLSEWSAKKWPGPSVWEARLIRNILKSLPPAEGKLSFAEFAEEGLRKNQLPFAVDLPALEVEGIDINTVDVPRDGTRATIRKLLTTALEAKELQYVMADEMLIVTTKTREEQIMTAEMYIPNRAGWPNASAEQVYATVMKWDGTGPWENTDGVGGSMALFGPMLIVRHAASRQARLKTLFAGGK